MQPSRAEACLALLEAAYDELPASKAELYRGILIRFEWVDAEPAIRWLIEHEVFRPRPAELLTTLEETRRLRLEREAAQRQSPELQGEHIQPVTLRDALLDDPDLAERVEKLRGPIGDAVREEAER